MRSALLVSTLAALAAAAPRPQDIEFEQVDSSPDAVIVDPLTAPADVPVQAPAVADQIAQEAVTDVASPNQQKRDFLHVADSLSKRGDCSPLPAGTGPTINNPDTAEAFLAYQPFKDDAINAIIPDGYTLAFRNLEASSQTVSYLGYELLDSYDVLACARICDNKQGCHAFNLYYERDPTTNSDPVNCPNLDSSTNIKCVRWGVSVDASTALNTGSTRSGFQVVISGSNGYNKITAPPAQPGFLGPVQLGGAINAPVDPKTKTNTYMGYKFFSFAQVQTFDLGVKACTAACTAQTAYNSRHPPALPALAPVCNQVVAYVLSDQNRPQGIYCAMYTEEWATNYATNVGQFRGNDYWSVSQAYAYTDATYDAKYEPICDKGGCPGGSYGGGNCGGYGPGKC